jgi:2-keto-3-deoxy-galactonokinase
LLLLIFLGVQTGLWLFGRNVAEQSAREAVSRLRVTVVGADLASATAAARVQAENYVRNVGGNLVQDPTATADQVGEARVRVTVTGTAISLVPGLSFTVRGSAEGDVEQFQVDE